ncbi:methyl methanesulfonate sensitivity 4 [Lasioglossum baleicum]|uniref:methyl methanesulfonate sensitivity 4 n=1 Tax=Lasioglossum baleicum TaxID=434251 RepID=UPI003FCE59F7
MADVVVLSDSDVSITSIPNDKVANIDEDDYEFPEVQFHHVADVELLEADDCSYKNRVPNVSPFKSNRICSSSLSAGTTSIQTKRRNVQASSRSTSVSPEPAIETIGEDRGKKATQVDKANKKKPKSQLTEEKLKRQEQLARDRALKAIASKNSKNIKPGECMKFIEVVLDKGIERFSCKNEIITTLLDASVRYSIREELIPNSIAWKRSIENSYIDEANEICTVTDTENVKQILIIWNWDEGVIKVADGSFCTTISSIKATLPNYNMMLVIYGIGDYFACRKQSKKSGKNGEKTQKTKRKNSYEFKNYPEISKQQLESCLNEIQIITKCSSRLINTSEELSLMIYQCTKAIAEIPFKAEKNKSLTSKFDWYVMGDNRNSVRVDKDGNGLKRLWQQQLCQFNLSSLEIAEAICSVYRCPADLMEAYNNCTQTEGMNLLKDIPIRRAVGPLTTSRKVGPELSKKVYIMFTSEDGETLLS